MTATSATKTLKPIEEMDWPIDLETKPQVMPVDNNAEWFHGTNVAPFERINPGTCFTKNEYLAAGYAESGPYQHQDWKGEHPRIVKASINLPEGAPLLMKAPLFGQYLDMIESSQFPTFEQHEENHKYAQAARAEYHEAAAKLATDLGFPAYWADMYFSKDKQLCLVVLDPDAVSITDHHGALPPPQRR